jgi:hypothetical protein
VGLVFSLSLMGVGCDRGLTPLVSAPAAGVTGPSAPADAIVLGMAQAKEIQEPFIKQENPASPDGVMLALPRKSALGKGSATLKATVPAAGDYRAWLHVRWRDACGNSVGIRVVGASDRTVEDALYGEWHWVRAGQFALTAGPHSFVLLEREEGVQLDQFLLTRDETFVPVGLIGRTGGPVELMRFADDFTRSPGHGLEGWEPVSGKWDINFSFDPNRIPNQ